MGLSSPISFLLSHVTYLRHNYEVKQETLWEKLRETQHPLLARTFKYFPPSFHHSGAAHTGQTLLLVHCTSADEAGQYPKTHSYSKESAELSQVLSSCLVYFSFVWWGCLKLWTYKNTLYSDRSEDRRSEEDEKSVWRGISQFRRTTALWAGHSSFMQNSFSLRWWILTARLNLFLS